MQFSRNSTNNSRAERIIFRVQGLLSDESKIVVDVKRAIYHLVKIKYNKGNLNRAQFFNEVNIIFHENVFDVIADRLNINSNYKDREAYNKIVECAKKKIKSICDVANDKNPESLNYGGWHLIQICINIIGKTNIEDSIIAIRSMENALKSNANNEFLSDNIEIIDRTKQDLFKLIVKTSGPDCLYTKSFFNGVELILDKNIYSILDDKFKILEEMDLLTTMQALIDQIYLKRELFKVARNHFKKTCMTCFKSWPAHERFVRWSPQDIYIYVMDIIGIKDLFDAVASVERYFDDLDAYISKILFDVQEAAIKTEDESSPNQDETKKVKDLTKSKINDDTSKNASKTIPDSEPTISDIWYDTTESESNNPGEAKEISNLNNFYVVGDKIQNSSSIIWDLIVNIFWSIVRPFLPN